MAATPETLKPEAPVVTERQEEFVVPETLQQQTGVQAVQKTFKSQVTDDKGVPMTQSPPAQVISVQPPYPQTVLQTQAKGSTTSALTWLSAFWLRIIKKAIHFGWKILGNG